MTEGNQTGVLFLVAPKYNVIGWKINPDKGLIVVFEAARTPNPQMEAQKALALGALLVEVRRSDRKRSETPREKFENLYQRVGARDREGRFAGIAKDKPSAYSVVGFVSTARYHSVGPSNASKRVLFKSEPSVDPVGDLSKALQMRCTEVIIGQGYTTEGLPTAESEDPRERDEETMLEQLANMTFLLSEPVPAHCSYERKWSSMRNPSQVWFTGILPGIEGTCASCGRKIYRLGKLI